MKVLNRTILEDFKWLHAEAKSQVDTWLAIAEEADWRKPLDIKRQFAKASILADNHVIFDFCGNKYRLGARVDYKNKIIFIKAAGTHNEYEKWNLI